MKKLFFIVIICLFIILFLLLIPSIINWLFSEQYNSKGISHFFVVTIDKKQPKEYIGKLDGYNVYIEGLNLSETNFRSVDAKNVSIKYAIDNKLVSVNEWRKYALRIKKSNNSEILRYENYEIYIKDKDCIIRPIN